ncbi:MAG: ribonuclease Z [Prevotella sp.]|nr:ribonuclease Z [Prevotella sp.]MCR5152270.1 ribonuclease Z [Prevotella sp.]
MEQFNVHILGCGSALPTIKHNPSCQIVEMRGKMFMVDCSEGAQLTLRKSHIAFGKINSIFISHMHADHCLGLPGLITTFSLLDRTAPLHIYGPAQLEIILNHMLEAFCHEPSFSVTFHAVDTTKKAVIYEDHGCAIESIPLQHRLPCCGFLFSEKTGRRHIIRDACDRYAIPFCQFDNLRCGLDYTAPDGTIIPNDRLTLPPDPVRRYAYCSDTRYFPELAQMVEGVDLLYHESTYGDDRKANAAKYYHSTAREAATTALNAKVRKLMLGHYSARYTDETVLLDQALTVFPDTILSDEGMTVSI